MMDRDRHRVAVTGERFVDGVVDDLVHQVMEARGAMPYIIDPFAYQGRPMFSCLTGGTPPVLSIHKIER